jgi:hypothetical protein
VKREKFYYKDKIHAWLRTVNDELNQNKAVQTGLLFKPTQTELYGHTSVTIEKRTGLAILQSLLLQRKSRPSAPG